MGPMWVDWKSGIVQCLCMWERYWGVMSGSRNSNLPPYSTPWGSVTSGGVVVCLCVCV